MLMKAIQHFRTVDIPGLLLGFVESPGYDGREDFTVL
jgi:hypothetical protein